MLPQHALHKNSKSGTYVLTLRPVNGHVVASAERSPTLHQIAYYPLRISGSDDHGARPWTVAGSGIVTARPIHRMASSMKPEVNKLHESSATLPSFVGSVFLP